MNSLLNEKDELYIKIDRMKTNFSSFDVLQILGITKKKILQSIGKKDFLMKSINFRKDINKRNSMRITRNVYKPYQTESNFKQNLT